MVCPPPPACPPVLAEPSIVGSEREREPVPREPEPRELIAPDQNARFQATLSAAMHEANIRASFDFDCAARPCLAVFAGQIPNEDERAAVIQRLVESQPGINLTSTTIIGEDDQVSWVLGLADQQLTSEERALVDTRIDDLLRP
jgi:hypothetical protein